MLDNYKTIYYTKIVELISKIHHNEFSNAKPGHCMKITGLGEEQLLVLWENLKLSFPNIDSFIILLFSCKYKG